MSDDKDDKKEKFEKLDKYISNNYPEAYIYYAMAKLFHWPPHVVDEIDVDLCRVFLGMEEKVNADAEEEMDRDENIGRRSERKTSSFPEKWKDMKVKDIIKTEEFKQKLDENGKIFKLMKRKHSVK